MNHFKFHIGDYAAATGHLSFLEDAAYSRLIRIYYGSEKPIPLDRRSAYRLVRAQSKQEREAVDVVLEEFFEQQGDGWHQKRCDEELATYHERAEVNRELGKRGGRPRKTETVSEKNRNGFKLETETVSEKNPSHKPLTNNQERAKDPESPNGDSPPSPDGEGANGSAGKLNLTAPTDLGEKKAQRLRQVTIDAITAFNAKLGKPNGNLASVSLTIGLEKRQQQVKRCLKLAMQICREQYGDPRITPEFWTAYFAEVDRDPFKSGRTPAGEGHANWRPTFEYLTREKTMLEVFDAAVAESAA